LSESGLCTLPFPL